MRHHKHPRRAILTFIFATLFFCILAVTMIISVGIVYVLMKMGLFGVQFSHSVIIPSIILGFASILIGTILSAIASKIPLRPVNKLIHGMNQLASGEFETRITLGKMEITREISKSFNTLAEELQNTEMLRSDFVNDFSHEFKTPIVSIRGFAKLLRKGNLTEEQKQEYLDIIVDETSRLADLATNVLNLTKVENQHILTDIVEFNLSEQIRNCILLLEKKWSAKEINIDADFTEHIIYGNDELLKQVWINLLDNAIKFSPKGERISITMLEESSLVKVKILNYGPEIPIDNRMKIFDKFWQGERSRSTEGTGIGLSLTRRIISLHKGNVEVESSNINTSFIVSIPMNLWGD